MMYTVSGYREVVSYEKVWIQVEADTLEEAIDLAFDDKGEEIDYKPLDIVDSNYIDKCDWS